MSNKFLILSPNKQVIYIGNGRIRSRLKSHFLNGTHPIPQAAYYRVKYIGSKLRAEQKERALLADHEYRYRELPRFNRRFG